MGVREVKKLGDTIGDYMDAKEAIIARLNVINSEREAIEKYELSETGRFYSAVLDIEGDVITLLDEIKEYKLLHNKEV